MATFTEWKATGDRSAFSTMPDGSALLTIGNESWTEADYPLPLLEALLYAWTLTEAMDLPGDVHAFIVRLQASMTDLQFATALLANVTAPFGICHMHDYCDPNQIALDVAGDDVDAAGDLYYRAAKYLGV